MQRTFKYRLYPNHKQQDSLAAQLDMCRELYNAAVPERIESYAYRKAVTWLDQQAQLPAIKAVRPEFKNVRAMGSLRSPEFTRGVITGSRRNA
jgi:putative transposase